MEEKPASRTVDMWKKMEAMCFNNHATQLSIFCFYFDTVQKHARKFDSKKFCKPSVVGVGGDWSWGGWCWGVGVGGLELGGWRVARGFATWKIRHRRFATKKIRHTTDETCECDREFERKRRTNVCNNAVVEDSPRNGDRLKSGGRLGLGGLKSGRLSRGVGPGGLG